MAMKNCDECGAPISDKAYDCLQCGAPTTTFAVAVVFASAVTFGLGLWVYSLF